MTETVVMFYAGDGRKFLRGVPPNEPGAVERIAKSLGATFFSVLGTIEGGPETVVTEYDYGTDGKRIESSKHTRGLT